MEITPLSKRRHFDIVLNFCVILISVCFITCPSYSELWWQYLRYFLVPLKGELMSLTAQELYYVFTMPSSFCVWTRLWVSEFLDQCFNFLTSLSWNLFSLPSQKLLQFCLLICCQVSPIFIGKTSFSVLHMYPWGSILWFYGSNAFLPMLTLENVQFLPPVSPLLL